MKKMTKGEILKMLLLAYRDATQTTVDSTIFEFNMSALTTLLRRQAEQNPSASYFNVDILKYQIKCKDGAGSCPFQLVAYWKCETTHTDLKVQSSKDPTQFVFTPWKDREPSFLKNFL